MTWHTDISQAPRGKTVTRLQPTSKGLRAISVFEPGKVILATKCGKVTTSHWLPDEQRWLMLAKGEQPVAWHAWPTHPHSSLPSSQATDTAGGVAPPAPPAPIQQSGDALSARSSLAAREVGKPLQPIHEAQP